MNQTRLLWRRVCQGFYVKTIMLQLQQPTPGFNTDSLTLTCLPQWKHSNHTLQLLYLYSKRTKQKITIFVPRAISLCELYKQTKFFFFRDVITFYSQIQPYFVKIWGGGRFATLTIIFKFMWSWEYYGVSILQQGKRKSRLLHSKWAVLK